MRTENKCLAEKFHNMGKGIRIESGKPKYLSKTAGGASKFAHRILGQDAT